ncbi:endo-1,4-beta-xylanase 1-like isoform X1 [Haliotis rufescens]|uniref:endo-1,4-beta-xylanase 1-like isoform X1 n=1 Tax=Haliotis rufescens TaxID=6454 RepID=UPI00201F3E6E|nr:endo-1,4-beta-xylanase 1-like isoform X1 [Haliotis rufescens]
MAKMVVLITLLFSSLVRGQNLVLNGDMESLTNWDCWGFHCELTTDHHSGHHGIKATGRTMYYMGPSQILTGVHPAGRYWVEGYVKLLNDEQGKIGQKVDLELAVNFTDGTISYIPVASQPLVRASDGWVQIIGDFSAPSKAIKNTRIYFQGASAGVSFIVDDMSITPIVANQYWRAESDSVIERLRKSDIKFEFTLENGISSNQVEIDIIQTKKSFPFGTAVSADDYVHGDSRYQDFINKHFNWAVSEASLKWDIMEPAKGQINYKRAFDMIYKLLQNGKKIRAHNVVWSEPKYVPQWVRPLTGSTLKNTVQQRIQDIVGRTKNLVEHWDVDNENLHGFWFQDTLHDRDYNLDIFRIAHQAGPNVKLFLNDYDVVALGSLTTAYRDQAVRFKNANVGLHGVGVQCHFTANTAPDPTLIKKHLDIISEAGLPIWVTEFDVMASDEHTRADWYETALRAFYGHPAVEGIMLWGFWSKRHWRGEPAALVSGDSFTLNAAGQRFLHLTEDEWMTKETHRLDQSGTSFTTRGFHGDYEAVVKVNGKEVTSLRQYFTLESSPKAVSVHVHQ